MASSTVNGAALPGSPLTTAILAPFGNTAGAGPHCSAAGFAAGAAGAAGAACEESAGAATSKRHAGKERARIGPPRDREWCDEDGAPDRTAEEVMLHPSPVESSHDGLYSAEHPA